MRARSAATAARARSSRSRSSRAARSSSAKVRCARRCEREGGRRESPSDEEEAEDAEVGVVAQDGELPPGASDDDRRAREADRHGGDRVLSSVVRAGEPERERQRDNRDRPKDPSPAGPGIGEGQAGEPGEDERGSRRTGSGAARAAASVPRSGRRRRQLDPSLERTRLDLSEEGESDDERIHRVALERARASWFEGNPVTVSHQSSRRFASRPGSDGPTSESIHPADEPIGAAADDFLARSS